MRGNPVGPGEQGHHSRATDTIPIASATDRPITEESCAIDHVSLRAD
ncbi:hypothetical protein [Jannaschia seohaensis]|uniref:Uncharacterized protein n=1 Tax=Jannaschia seohaensis TaxID=475081 RepID=A0A2Y9B7K2_9RHOB|nr:hypothetical protein [Jannaschia seohaensis]PWJ14442.1 hypothetical protein BCF38_11265 [Jannaschia seohaensis]SSA50179.1 hypothetical protein SAMN05421539_11265 [Jannaschia seohaensis]